MGLFNKLFGKKSGDKAGHQIPHPNQAQDIMELMEAKDFWHIVDATKPNAQVSYEKQQVALDKELSKLDPINIVKFDNTFRKLRGELYKWELWGAAYIMNGGCSDDCFSDFRGWLIGHGKAIYNNAMNDPESLVEINYNKDNVDWEGLCYIPMIAYEKKTGSLLPNGINENFEITGEEWNEDGDDLKKRFPKLWAKWGME